jgi:hypothetical protein
LDLFSSPNVHFVSPILAAATGDHLRQFSSNGGKNEGRCKTEQNEI